MSDQQLRDECMTFFLAGHETTANGLTWMFYLLARHPEVQQRLQAELDSVLGARAVEFADFAQLPYLEKVIYEGLRMYPPVWTLARRPVEDINFGGYDIKKGSVLILSQWVMHRDPRYFPEPDRFDPERWTPELRAARPKLSFFGFSAGVRQCIGADMAWLESGIVLAQILQRWSVSPVDERPVPPQATLTLRPKYPVKLRVTPREPRPAR
jgi:cytochrome P450